MALQLNAIPAAQLVQFGVINGTSQVIPQSSVSAYIGANAMLVLVDPASPTFHPVAQYAFSVAAGLDETKAALIAGARAGFYNSLYLLNWMLHGNTGAAIDAALAAGAALFARPANAAAATALHAGLTWADLADEAAYVALRRPSAAASGAGVAGKYPDLASVMGTGLSVTVRANEVRVVGADYDVTQAAWDSLRDPSGAPARAFQEGAEQSLNFLALISVHLIKMEGHHWISRKDANVCYPFFVKLLAGSKAMTKEAVVNAIMHDVFHPFRHLGELFNLYYSLDYFVEKMNDSVLWRYPPALPGTSVVGATAALVVEIKVVMGTHVVAAGQQVIMDDLFACVAAAVLDVSANSANWASGAHAHREARNVKVTAFKQLAAFLHGVATALKIPADSHVMEAPSVVNAAAEFAGQSTNGATVGAAILAAPIQANMTSDMLGITVLATAVTAAW